MERVPQDMKRKDHDSHRRAGLSASPVFEFPTMLDVDRYRYWARRSLAVAFSVYELLCELRVI